MKAPSYNPRVLALDPGSRDLGFAVLEGPQNLIDWGAKATRKDKHALTLRKVADLINQYEPDVIVLEDGAGPGSHRSPRILELIQDIRVLAAGYHIKTMKFSRSRIRKAFSENDACTKEQIAAAIGRHFPELASLVPPHRKSYMSENHHMQIFDGVSLALTFFYRKHRPVPHDFGIYPSPIA